MKKQPSAQNFWQDRDHPYSQIPWDTLNDIQKSQLLLNSTRLFDSEKFCDDFQSFETPTSIDESIVSNSQTPMKSIELLSQRHIKIDKLMLQAFLNLKNQKLNE